MEVDMSQHKHHGAERVVEGRLPRASARLSVNKQDVAMTDLGLRLRDLFADRTDKTMFVMAAGSLRSGDIVEVIDAATGAGVTRVGIVTDQMRR
jgi:biopolymer transport protein ExbD